MKHAKKYRVLAPLEKFYWTGNDFSFGDILQIKRFDSMPDLEDLESELGFGEATDIKRCTHWLVFDYEPKAVLNNKNIISLFLLALWLAVPTTTRVELSFEFAVDPKGVQKEFKRYLDRFQYIKGYTKTIKTENLEKAFVIFNLLIPIVKKKKRLWNALVMTIAGCMSYRWQVAFVNFSAAVETILTYEKTYSKGQKTGITKKLAKTYASLLAIRKRERNKEYRRFIKLYSVRSDIVHGKMHKIRKPRKGTKGERNLENLVNFEELVRKLWVIVLNDKLLSQELEKSDLKREQFLDKRESTYNPPAVKIKI